MSAIRIIRGIATLPTDLEEQFFRAYGRQMTAEERKFFEPSSRKGTAPSAENQTIPAAA